MAGPSSAAGDASNYSPASPTFLPNPDLYDLLVDQPPPSILPSEASSPLASGSDLLPSSSTKATKQINLLGFFSKVPSSDLHANWQKRKRENEDKDSEEYAEWKKKDEAQQLHKLGDKYARNNVAQKKQWEKIKEQQAELPDPLVGLLGHILLCQHMLIFI